MPTISTTASTCQIRCWTSDICTSHELQQDTYCIFSGYGTPQGILLSTWPGILPIWFAFVAAQLFLCTMYFEMAIQGHYLCNIFFADFKTRNGQVGDLVTLLTLEFVLTSSMDEYPTIRLPTQPRIFTPGLGMAFVDENGNPSAENAPGNDFSSNLLFLTNDLRTKLQQQRDESDQFITAQAEHLRRSVSEKSQRQMTSLLTLTGESISRHLRDKNMEIEEAILRNRVLVEKLNQLKLEAQMWKMKARSDEAIVATLKRDLQQAVAQSRELRKEGVGDGEADDAGSAYLDPNAEVYEVNPVGRDKTTCKVCQRNTVSILLLPCRHLCCRDCEAIIVACPLCFAMKEASVEVYMS